MVALEIFNVDEIRIDGKLIKKYRLNDNDTLGT